MVKAHPECWSLTLLPAANRETVGFIFPILPLWFNWLDYVILCLWLWEMIFLFSTVYISLKEQKFKNNPRKEIDHRLNEFKLCLIPMKGKRRTWTSSTYYMLDTVLSPLLHVSFIRLKVSAISLPADAKLNMLNFTRQAFRG